MIKSALNLGVFLGLVFIGSLAQAEKFSDEILTDENIQFEVIEGSYGVQSASYPTARNTCAALNSVLRKQGYIDLSTRFFGVKQRNYLTRSHGSCYSSRTHNAKWSKSTVIAKDGSCSLGYTCLRTRVKEDKGDNGSNH